MNDNIKKLEVILNDVIKIKEKVLLLEKKIKEEIEDFYKTKEKTIDKNSKIKKQKRQYDERELTKEWDILKQKIKQTDNPKSLIDNFVKNKTKDYLAAFIRKNNLTIDPRLSKDKIAKELLQLIKISEIIKTGKPM